MKIQEKPDYLIFADSAKSGECTNFPDVSRGWGVTIDQTGAKPPMEWMNGAFNRIDKNMLYLLQQGVPEWSENVTYPANALIKYNGVLYTATVKNDNAIPTTSDKWKKTIAEIHTASTAQMGIVQLNSDINSESETEAATPKAVKSAYDLASNAVKKSGDEITGQLRFSPTSYGVKFRCENGNELVLQPSGDSFVYAYYDAKSNTWTNKLRYANNGNTWRFENIDDVTINDKSVLTTGDAVQLFGDLSNINLNNLTAFNAGIYFQGRNIQAILENNYPINEAGTLQVFKNGADGAGCCQIYTAYRNARQFIRNFRGGTKTWEPWVEQITTANINKYIPVGDQRMMPFRHEELPFGWYFRNGDNFLLDSSQGRALNSLSANYKRDHNIAIKTINGRQYINVPTAFAPDGRGFFERAVNGGSRQVGSWEDDAIRNIRGSIGNVVVSSLNDSDVFYHSNTISPAYAGNNTGSHVVFNFDASRVVPTAHENRPVNIGMTPVIYLGV